MNDIYDVLEYVLKDNKGASSKKIQEIMFMTYGYSYEDTRRAQEALKKADGSIARPNYWVDKGSLNNATAQDWDAVRPDISEPNDATDPLSYQVGGEHYTKKKIQPVEYIHANEMDYMDGAIVKYISRWRDKDGVKDLRKIKQFVDLIIKLNKL